jgi:hypothetical protein
MCSRSSMRERSTAEAATAVHWRARTKKRFCYGCRRTCGRSWNGWLRVSFVALMVRLSICCGRRWPRGWRRSRKPSIAGRLKRNARPSRPAIEGFRFSILQSSSLMDRTGGAGARHSHCILAWHVVIAAQRAAGAHQSRGEVDPSPRTATHAMRLSSYRGQQSQGAVPVTIDGC